MKTAFGFGFGFGFEFGFGFGFWFGFGFGFGFGLGSVLLWRRARGVRRDVEVRVALHKLDGERSTRAW